MAALRIAPAALAAIVVLAVLAAPPSSGSGIAAAAGSSTGTAAVCVDPDGCLGTPLGRHGRGPAQEGTGAGRGLPRGGHVFGNWRKRAAAAAAAAAEGKEPASAGAGAGAGESTSDPPRSGSAAGQDGQDDQDDKPSGLYLGLLPELAEGEAPASGAAFIADYLRGEEAVVLRGAARGMPAFTAWRNDSALAAAYGDVRIDAETRKVERREDGQSRSLLLRRFLELYTQRELFAVAELGADMRSDVTVPAFLRCGGLLKYVSRVVLWMSSGGTRSVLHNDFQHNFNCLLDGDKELVLFDPRQWRQLMESPAAGWNAAGTYSSVDVDAVDVEAFPAFAEMTYYRAKLHAGDCIFIPRGWYHQVNSGPSRNMAVNIWFNEDEAQVNLAECEQPSPADMTPTNIDDLIIFRWEAPSCLDIGKTAQQQPIARADFRRGFGLTSVGKQGLDQLFDELDDNGDGRLDKHEVGPLLPTAEYPHFSEIALRVNSVLLHQEPLEPDLEA